MIIVKFIHQPLLMQHIKVGHSEWFTPIQANGLRQFIGDSGRKNFTSYCFIVLKRGSKRPSPRNIEMAA